MAARGIIRRGGAISGSPDAPGTPNITGVINSTSTETYNITESNKGSVTLSAQPSFSGTSTFTKNGVGSTDVYAAQSCGYLQLSAGHSLKIGNVNRNITESFYMGVLCRINVATVIEQSGITTDLNIIKTNQSGTSGLWRQMFVAPRNSAKGATYRRRLYYAAEGFDTAGPAGPNTKYCYQDYSSSYTPSYTTTLIPTPFGDSTAANGCPNSHWIWLFVRGHGVGETETGGNFMSDSSGTYAAQTLYVGHQWLPRQWIGQVNTGLLNFRVGAVGASPSTALSTNQTGVNHNVTPNLTNLDFNIGDTNYPIDIARVVKISKFIRSAEMVMLHSGLGATDIGLVPLADDFDCWFGSQTQAQLGISGAEIGATSGTYIPSGGPICLRPLGNNASSSLVVTTTNGIVT